jgi:uncharacterized protein YcfJ
MLNKLWIVGLTTVALVAPQLASAHSYCEEQAHHRRVVGTVAGAAGGALIGGLVGHGAAAPLIGAAGGAIVGNQLARTKCHEYRRAEYHHRRHDYHRYG